MDFIVSVFTLLFTFSIVVSALITIWFLGLLFIALVIKVYKWLFNKY